MTVAVRQYPPYSNVLYGNISMNIYEILSSKKHNKHFLSRYLNFIEYCREKNDKNTLQYKELHHICPKGKTFFPEFSNLKENSWNGIYLTGRQHFIAHKILAKTYPNTMMVMAYLRMMNSTSKRVDIKFTSKEYENAKIEFIKVHSETHKEWHKNNAHPRGNLGKTRKRTKEQNEKFIGEKNPQYGKKRPDLSDRNRNISIEIIQKSINTRKLNHCIDYGFTSYEDAKKYFTELYNKFCHLPRKIFLKMVIENFLQDFPERTRPHHKLISTFRIFDLEPKPYKTKHFSDNASTVDSSPLERKTT